MNSFIDVEKAEEEWAPESWIQIGGGWVMPGLDEVMEFLVERRTSKLLQRLEQGRWCFWGRGGGVFISWGRERGKLLVALVFLYD